MKATKRILAIMLAVMLTAALMVIPASAAGDYTVTIESTIPGHTYEIYQIFKGDLNATGVLTHIQWGSGVSADGKTALGDADAKAGTLKTPADAKAFGNQLTPYLTNPVGTDDYDENKYEFTGLEAGYYLVKDAAANLGENDAFTKYIIQVVGNVNMAPKVGTPTLEKLVSRNADSGFTQAVSAATNHEVYFSLTASMHTQIENYDKYYLKFTDVMPKGLTYEAVTSVYVTSENDTTQKKPIDAQYYTVTAGTPDAEGNTTVTIVVDEVKDAIYAATQEAAMPDDKIVVVIKAKLNGNADIGLPGNTNVATLQYTNEPNDISKYQTSLGTATSSDAIVYTYELQVKKVDAVDNTKLLPGAKFVLYHYKNSTDIVYVTVDTATGLVTGTVSAQGDATVVESDSNGMIYIKGLHSGTYYLKEVAPPDGYNLRVEDVAVAINGTLNAATGQLDTFTANATHATGAPIVDKNAGTIQVTIGNRAGATLPETGGIGTTIFYVLGAVLVIGAAAVVVMKKRNGEQA